MTVFATTPSAPRVLIVEDDWFIRTSIAAHFRSEGWLVFEACTGEAGVAYLQSEEPLDVLFTDIQLGGVLTGWDVGEAFRAVHVHLPVIYASGRPVEPTRLVQGGVFLSKPYQPAAVMKACRGLQ